MGDGVGRPRCFRISFRSLTKSLSRLLGPSASFPRDGWCAFSFTIIGRPLVIFFSFAAEANSIKDVLGEDD